MTNLDDIILAIASAVNANGVKIGDLSNLNTPQKTSIVAAINALVADIASRENITTESVQRIVRDGLAEFTDGASDAYNTFKEIEDSLNDKDNTINNLLTLIGKVERENAALKEENAALKTFVGYEQRETLRTQVMQLLGVS